MGRHSLRDAAGFDVIGSGDAFGPGGRHSRELIDAPTERIPALAGVLAWFGDDTDPTEPIGDDADTQFIPRIEADRKPPPPRSGDPWTPPPRELTERVLEGLKRLFTDTPEGEEPDEPDND